MPSVTIAGAPPRRKPRRERDCILDFLGGKTRGQESRDAITNAVSCHPGATRSQLCRLTGLAWGSVAHHVDAMKARGELVAVRRGARELHFHPLTPAAHRHILAVLCDRLALRIVEKMRQTDSLGIQRLAGSLEESRKTVRRHLSILRDAQLLEESDDYRPRFHLTPEAARWLDQTAQGLEPIDGVR